MAKVVKVGQSRAGVLDIVLASPRNRNALSAQLLEEFVEALSGLSREDVRVAVISAEGPTFCAGADLQAVARGEMEPILRGIVEVQRLMVQSDKPVVGRVQGATRAGGLGIIAGCDVAVGTRNATFAFTEVRLGLAPGRHQSSGATSVESARSSADDADRCEFDGVSAHAAGLLTAVVADHELDGAVQGAVDDLLRGDPQGSRETKTLLNGPVRSRLDDLSDVYFKRSLALFDSDSARAHVRRSGVTGQSVRS